MGIIISLKNVRKLYRMGDEKIVALDDISIDFEEGKFYCLLGTSGSGKSTLLNLIAGLEKPSKGEIIFKNHHIEKMNEKQLTNYRQKYIGFVFQSYNLLPSFSALENVTLPLIFKKVPKKERNKRAKAMLKAVGLANREKHRPSQLSGGQQQRVSIARAFINNPRIVFADEPTGNLDTKTTYEMMDLITGMAKANNQTLIIVTHDLEIAHYANTIVYIRDGNIEKIEQVPETEVKGENEIKSGNEIKADAEIKAENEIAPKESAENTASENIKHQAEVSNEKDNKKING